MFLIVVLLLVVGFVPIRSKKIDGGLQEKLNEWFDGSATFSSSKMKLFRGIYLDDFTIYEDSSKQKVVFQSPLVMFKINPLFYPFTRAVGIYAREPELVLQIETGGVDWPESFASLNEKNDWVISEIPSYLRIDDGKVLLAHDGEPIVHGRDIDLAVRRLKSLGKKPLEYRGELQWNEHHLTMQMEGEINPQESEIILSGAITPTTGENIVFNWPRAELMMDAFTWDIQMTREGPVFQIQSEVHPQDASLAFEDGNLTLGVNQATANLYYDKDLRKLDVEDVLFQWEDYQSQVQGAVSFADHKPFNILFASDDLPAQVVSNILDLRFPERPVDFIDGQLAFQVKASGLIANVTNIVYQGKVSLHGSTFEHPATGFRIPEVSGEITFNPEQVLFEDLQAQYGSDILSVSGSLKGTPYIWQDPQLTLVTDGSLDLSETGTFIENLAPGILEDVQPDGTAKLNLNIKGPANEPDRMEVSGKVYLNGVSLSGGSLPVPFHGIQGNILVDEEEMRIETVQGTTGRSMVQVAGIWSRGEDSWTDGQIKIDIEGDAESSEIFPAVSKAAAGLEGYVVEGPFVFDLAISGPVDSPTDIDWHGEVILKDAVIRNGIFEASLTDVTGEIDFKADKITSVVMNWKRRNVPGRLSYEEQNENNILTVKADFLLNEVKRISERYLDLDFTEYKTSGNLFIDMTAEWKKGQIKEADLRGRIDFEAGAVNHKDWLLPLESIEGIVKIDESVFLTDRLSVSSGNAQATVKGRYKDGAFSIESLSDVNLAQILDKARRVYKGRFDNWNAGGTAGFVLSSEHSAIEGVTKSLRRTHGRLNLQDAYLQSNWMKMPVKNLNGEVEFSPEGLESEALGFSLGSTRGTAQFQATEMKHPRVSGSVDAEFIDFNGLLGFFDVKQTIEGEQITAIPVRLVSGKVKAASFGIHKLSGSDLDMDLNFVNTANSLGLSLSEVAFTTSRGTVAGEFNTLLQPDAFIYSGSAETSSVALDDFIRDVEFEDQGEISGDFDLVVEFSGNGLDLSNLVAKGEFLGSDMRLTGNKLFVELGQESKMNIFEDIPFEKIYTPFLLLDNRVYTPDMRWIGDVAEMLWQGSFGLDRSLNYSFNAAISASAAPGTSQLADNEETSATFKFLTTKTLQMALQGNLSDPKFSSKPLKSLIEPDRSIEEVQIQSIDTIR